MKNTKIVLPILLIMLLFSCKTTKVLNEKNNPKPEWVTIKPQNSTYYTGVSSSIKRGYSPGEYIQSAQQRALADLASSISVNIESTSVLSIIEDNYNIHENFSSEIIASTSQLLEGYELVETWEDENNYWVYYRLSKKTYNEQKEKKKLQTINEAKNKFNQANNSIIKKSQYNAFQFYVEALTTLKPYLGESTQTDINGETKDLGNLIFSSIADFINNMKFSFPSNEIIVKKGVNIDNETFMLIINDQNNDAVANIPVKVNFTGSGLLRNSETSDNNGKIFCSIKKIKSSPNVETLSVSIDMVSLSRVAKDPMIRDIIKGIPASESKIRVKVEKPVLYITDNEQHFGDKTTSKLKSTFESMLSSEFDIKNNDTPDFTLNISSNTTKNTKKYGEEQVTINYTFSLTDLPGNTIYRKSSSGEYTASTAEAASEKAYTEISKSIERYIARELINSINK